MYALLCRFLPRAVAGVLAALWYALLLLQLVGKAGVGTERFLYRF